MTTEQDIEKFEELVIRIEDHVNKGVWDASRHEETRELITQAYTLYDRIITAYEKAIPSFQQAYLVSGLQERLHQAQDNLPLPPV